MGRVAAATSKLYVNEHDLSGRSNAFELAVDNNLIPVTAFGDSAEEFVEALHGGMLNQNSFFDGASGNIDANIWDEIGAASPANVGMYIGHAATQGNAGYEFKARPNDEARPLQMAGAVLLNVKWTATGAIVRGTVMNNAAVTTSGVVSGSAHNLGVTSGNTRFVALLRVVAFSGTTMTVDIEQSSDNGGGDAYALISGMQQVITAVGSWRLSTVAATETWKRVKITAFTGTSITLMVTCGIELGT